MPGGQQSSDLIHEGLLALVGVFLVAALDQQREQVAVLASLASPSRDGISYHPIDDLLGLSELAHPSRS